MLAAAVVVLAALMVAERYVERERTRTNEEARLLGQAGTVADNMARELERVRSALVAVGADFPGTVLGKSSDQARRLQIICDMAGVRTIVVVDATGTVVLSNRPEFVGADRRDRDYFKSLPARPDPEMLYVSRPYTTALGVYSINVSRALTGPDGHLTALVSATLDPRYFEVTARSVLYADDMTASFVHGDGTLFFSLPELPGAVGKNLNRPGAIFTQHMASGRQSTVVSATLLVTGSRRMIANYTLQPADLHMDQPLVIGVARDLSGIYREWWRQTELIAFALALLTITAGLVLALAQRRRAGRIAKEVALEREREEQQRRKAQELTRRLLDSETGLRGTQEHLALAADAARLGIWIRDVKTDETWVSDGWRRIFGFAPTERVTVEQFMQIIHPEDVELLQRAREDLQRLGRYEAEYRIVLPDGRVRWIESRGRTEVDAEGRPVVTRAVSLDVTDRKLADLELERQRHEVAHLSRVVMLGELSGALAHELNQPLTAILSNAQAAQRFLAQEPVDLNELRAILDDIVAEDRRAGEVIRRLRELLSKGETQRHTLDINEMVSETLRLLRSDLTDQHISLATELDPALPLVRADGVQLQQVVINLLKNACDAMCELPATERTLTVRTQHLPDGGVRLSVIDVGCGLPGEDPDKVFESFYSTKPVGLGLGLSVCRSIISAHSGRLWCENNTGPGASFHFIVPSGQGRSA